MPFATLGYARGVEPVFTSAELNSPKGRLLAAAHAELMATQADRTAQTFVGLVRQLMLGPGPGGTPAQDIDLPLALILQDHVAANLHRPNLGINSMTMTFGISRATLYRHFESEGGLHATFATVGSSAVFFELADAKAKRRQAAEVARRWHFTDATHVNRLFRQRVGISPSHCLSSGALPGSGEPSDQLRIVEQRLQQVEHC